MNITWWNFWRPHGSRKDSWYPDSINLVNCVWFLFMWMAVRWSEETNNLSYGSLKFLDKINKKFLDHNSDVSFHSSALRIFWLLLLLCMSGSCQRELVSCLPTFKGHHHHHHHHGFELCVFECMHVYVYPFLGNGRKISSYTTAVAR
jgi:hypothetical protein